MVHIVHGTAQKLPSSSKIYSNYRIFFMFKQSTAMGSGDGDGKLKDDIQQNQLMLL
jgi:hypothetical protein